jgi:protein-arginine kinase activator protein McsA
MQNGKVNSYHMCKSCPLLKEKLKGVEPSFEPESSVFFKEGKSCPVCGLSAKEFMITLTLGCDVCVEAFKDILLAELFSQHLLPSNIQNTKDINTLHLGNIPKNRTDPSFTKIVETLHIALNEAVSSEHFEEAADIYAQIQKYLENPNAGTK